MKMSDRTLRVQWAFENDPDKADALLKKIREKEEEETRHKARVEKEWSNNEG